MSRGSLPERLAVGLVRGSLWTLPRRFRRRHGAAMLETFRLGWRDARRLSATRALLFLGRSVLGVLRAAVAERRDDSFEPRGPRAAGRSSRSLPGDPIVSTFLFDLRQALRGLSKRPGHSLVVILTLAVGIGANTAVFSVVEGVLLEPLPFPDSDELMSVWGRFDPESGFDFPIFPLSPPEYVDYRRQGEALDDLAAYHTTGVTLTGGSGDPEEVRAALVTPNLFRVVGVDASRGRTFAEEEGLPGADPVVLLSDALWQRRYGADPGVVGNTVRVDGVERVVVGIMPPGFSFPGREMRLWMPLRIDPADPGGRQSHYLAAIGRLAPNTAPAVAEAELETLMAAWQEEYPEIHTGHYLWLRPRLEDLVGDSRRALLMLWGASGFVLLIVCANLASMLLARAEDRGRELALRDALGASRGRLVGLLLLESGVLALIGGAAGVGLASLGVRGLLAVDPDGIPRADLVGVDGSVLAVAMLVSLVAGLLFALGPALRAVRRDPAAALHDGGRGSSDAGGGYWRRGLVVAEVALSFLLVLGAGLMIRSFDRLMAVDPGFEARGRLAASISLPAAEYEVPAQVEAFWSELVERVRAVPGVRSASAGTAVPLSGNSGTWDFRIRGRRAPAQGELAWNADVGVVRPAYFDTLGIELLRGRAIGPGDGPDAVPVTVINERMARTFFPDVDPLGQQIAVSGFEDNRWMTVVGIVEDVRYSSLAADPRPTYYLAHAQTPQTAGRAYRQLTVFLATDGEPEALVRSLRGVVDDLDPALPLSSVRTLQQTVHASAASDRFTTVLLGLFALVAVALGTTGVYGVLAYAVARRTREIGIRKALGAPRGGLVRSTVARAMVPVGIGLALGALASIWAGRVMDRLLFGVEALDPVTYGAVAAVLVGVSLLACMVPVRRALAVEPVEALRVD